MDEKITITAEISKNDVFGLFFLMGIELTSEIWEKLSKAPISINFDDIDKQERNTVKAALISLAISNADL